MSPILGPLSTPRDPADEVRQDTLRSEQRNYQHGNGSSMLAVASRIDTFLIMLKRGITAGDF